MTRKTRTELERENDLLRARIAELENQLSAPIKVQPAQETTPVHPELSLALLDLSHVVYAAIDSNFIYQYVNQSFLDYRQLHREQVIGRHVGDVIGWDLFTYTIQPRLRECLEGSPVHFETGVTYPDLGFRRINISYYPMRADTGEVTGILAISRDVTEQRQQEERWQLALESVGDGIWDLDLVKNQAYYSPRLITMLGYPADDPRFQNTNIWSSLVHPDDWEPAQQVIQAFTNGNLPEYANEYRVRCPDGTYRWILARGKALQWDSNGCPIRAAGTHTDITERKQVEQALRESEERLRLITDNMTDVVILQDVHGSILFITPSVEPISGYSQAELTGTIPDRLFDPLVIEQIIHPAYAKAHHEGVSGTFSYPFQRKRGGIGWIESNTRSILDENGAVLYFQTTSRDVTARRQAEEMFEKVFNATSVVMAIFTLREHTVVDVNQAACDFSGHSRSDMVGCQIENFLHAGNQHLVSKVFAPGLQKDGVKNLEVLFTKKDGRQIEGLISVDFIPAQDEPCILVSFVEITAMKKMERELRQSQKNLELFKTLVEQASEAIAVTSLDGKILYINPAYTQLMGRTPEEVLGVDFHSYYSPEGAQVLDNEIAPVLFREGSWVGVLDAYTKNNRRFPMWLRISLLRNPQDNLLYTFGFMHDDSHRIQAEADLRAAKEQAELANHAKSDFLAMVSHEIHTPMNSILGFTRLLSEKITDPLLRSYLAPIQSSGEALTALIDDILDLSRIEAGKLTVQYRPVLLRAIFYDVEQMFILRAAEKKLDFFSTIDPDLPGELFLDEKRLRQVLINLVGNAIKYTDSGYVVFSAHVITSRPGSVDLRISVEDTGSGIPPEDRDAIFEMFGRLRWRESRKVGGSGVGLAISRRLVELMNGSITIRDNQPHGTCFEVFLPGVGVPPAARAEFSSLIEAHLLSEADPDLPIVPLIPLKSVKTDYFTDQPPAHLYPTLPPEVVKALRSRFLPLWEQFREIQPVESLRRFSTELDELGRLHACAPISDYAANLLDAIDQFDIEAIDRLLGQFPGLVQAAGEE